MSKPKQLCSQCDEGHANALEEAATPKLIPLPEAISGYLGGISRSTLYALINNNELTRIHIGRRAFITGESIDGFLKGLA